LYVLTWNLDNRFRYKCHMSYRWNLSHIAHGIVNNIIISVLFCFIFNLRLNRVECHGHLNLTTYLSYGKTFHGNDFLIKCIRNWKKRIFTDIKSIVGLIFFGIRSTLKTTSRCWFWNIMCWMTFVLHSLPAFYLKYIITNNY